MRRGGVLLVTLVVAAAVLPSTAAGTDSGSVSPEELATAARFRAEFGFRSDIAHLEAVAGDPGASFDYGTPLTADEQAEMDRRVAIERRLGSLQGYLAGVPTFGGAYIDQAAGHVVDIAFTVDPEAHAVHIEQHLPSGAKYRLRSVEHSERELRDLQARVDADAEWLSDEFGVVVLENPIDPRTNRLEVGVSALTPIVDAALGERYGTDRVRVYETQPGGTTHCDTRNHCTVPSAAAPSFLRSAARRHRRARRRGAFSQSWLVCWSRRFARRCQLSEVLGAGGTASFSATRPLRRATLAASPPAAVRLDRRLECGSGAQAGR